jgi:hypothetical protein
MANEDRYDFKAYVLRMAGEAIDMYREYVEKHGEEDLAVAKAKALNEIYEGMNAEEEAERNPISGGCACGGGKVCFQHAKGE